MTSYYGGRRRKPSTSVLIPYILIYLIGLSTGYAIWHHSGQENAAPTKIAAKQPIRGSKAVSSRPVSKAAPHTPSSAKPGPSTVPASNPAPSKPAKVTPASQAVSQLEAVAAVWPARRMFIAVKGETLDDATKAMLQEIKPGGVVLSSANIKNKAQTIKLVHEIKDAVGLGTGIADQPLIAVAQEGGKMNPLRLKNAPSAAELGAEKDTSRTEKIGREYAAACVARGIGIVLAPVLDMYEPKTSPAVFATRSFRTDPNSEEDRGAVADHAEAFATGVLEGGVIPVAKHFPGLGAATQDPSKTMAVIKRGVAGLARIMYPFDRAARAGIPGMLVGHIAVPAAELANWREELPHWHKRPASLSPLLIKTMLRQRMGFRGLIIADDLNMGAITNEMPPEQAAVKALAAGCDVVMFLDPDPARVRSVSAAIDQAVKSGELSRAQLSVSDKRLDAWQAWLRKPVGLPRTVSETAVGNVPPPAASPPASAASKSPPTAVAVAKPQPKPAPAASAIETMAKATPAAPAKHEEEAAGAKKPPASKAESREVMVDITSDGNYFVDGQAVAEADLEAWLHKRLGHSKAVALVVRAGHSVDNVTIKKVLDLAQRVGYAKVGITAMSEEREKELAKKAAGEKAPPAPIQGPLGWPFSPPARSSAKPIEHTVEKGESIAKIATKYKVKSHDIEAWNHLEGKKIRPGQKLIVSNPAQLAPAPAPNTVAPPHGELSAPEKTNENAASAKSKAAQGKNKAEERAVPQPPHTKKIIHEIKPGEMLSRIAAKYGVKQKDIVAWNKLKDVNIKYGRKLIIYVPESTPETKETKPAPVKAPAAPNGKESGAALKSAPTGGNAQSGTTSNPAAGAPAHSAPVVGATAPPHGVKWVHTVTRGQKLSEIAAQYNVSVESLKRWNGLKSDKLHRGQKLDVYLGSSGASLHAKPNSKAEKSARPTDEQTAESERPTQTYVTESGDTVARLAEKYNISRKELLDMNHMNRGSQLKPGQILVVPQRP